LARYVPSKWTIASIESDDGLILPHRANPAGWNFREPQLFFVQRALFAKLIGDIHQNPTQNLTTTPSVKPAMHRFVVREALWQHMPLRTCIENPQDGFQNLTRRNRLAATPARRIPVQILPRRIV
jgi:hypothetical protein